MESQSPLICVGFLHQVVIPIIRDTKLFLFEVENKVLVVLLVEGHTEREDSVRNGVYYHIFYQYSSLF